MDELLQDHHKLYRANLVCQASKPRDICEFRLAGLVPLLDGDNYVLIGSPPVCVTVECRRHTDNHYGTPGVVDALVNIANEYERLHPGQHLQYNDMSIVLEGYSTSVVFGIPMTERAIERMRAALI